MQSLVLTSLIAGPISLSVSNKDTLLFRPGSLFELPVVLINNGDSALGWSQQNPLNLSYRWLTEDGELLERDGRRTAIPVCPIKPGLHVEFELAGNAPEDEGLYHLQLSLVLEGVHWACDVGTDGWVQWLTSVTPAPAWPTGLKESRGGRVLRGAMVAAELARHLEKRTFAVNSVQTETVAVTAAQPSLSDKPKVLAHPMRDWLRAMLGVRGLEQQLADVIALASGQEQRARGLEDQIATLKEELQIDLKLLKGRVEHPSENLAATRYDAPLVTLEAEARGTAAKVSQTTSRMFKESPKRSKASRKPAR
ncbi:MAG: hypothetical protein LH466_00955 [Sphingomonas bacterium]|nr:hypothetical protein [Sphingomonas bacterium]